MTLFGQQGFSRTKRAKVSQRESASALRTAAQLDITRNGTYIRTCRHTPSQPIDMHAIVHKHTLNIPDESVHCASAEASGNMFTPAKTA